jgi:hypothetical protein
MALDELSVFGALLKLDTLMPLGGSGCECQQ